MLRLLRLRNKNNYEVGAQTSLEQSADLQWVESASAFRGDWLFLVFLLALPVINPWYVAWLLPFATLYPRWWTWVVSYCCLLSYWHGANAGISGAGSLWLPPAVVAVEYLAVMAVTAIAWFLTRRIFVRRFSSLERYREFTGA